MPNDYIPKLSTKSYEYCVWQRDDEQVGINTIVSITRGSGSHSVFGTPTPPTLKHSFTVLWRGSDFKRAKIELGKAKLKSSWKPTMRSTLVYP